MAPANFLRLLAVFSLAILNISFDVLPANALAVERGHMARSINHAHAGFAKKRSNQTGKCKPRPVPNASPSMPPNSSPSPAPANVVHNATPAPNSQPTTTTTSSTPAQSPTPNTAAPSGGQKVALAWSNLEEASIDNFITASTKIIYNWKISKYPPADIGFSTKFQGLDFVPTIWGRDDITQISSVLTQGYATTVKTYNEPNIGGQANIPADEGCTLWNQHIEPLTQLGYRLIGPAVTTDTTGWNWLAEFMKVCSGASIAALDIHHYSLHPQDLINAANQYYNTYKKPIWVSEYGCVDYSGANQPCTQDLFNAFFQQTQTFFQSTSWIEMYAMFGMFRDTELPNGVSAVNSMMTCSSSASNSCSPNALGNQYLNP